MDVRMAVALAKGYVNELFAEEKVKNIGLEEVEFDYSTNVWSVTIGFTRPWEEEEDSRASSILLRPRPLQRSYKVVRIDDVSEKILSVKNREVAA